MTPSDLATGDTAKPAPAPVLRPANMLAHISARGDVTGHDGVWLGDPGSTHAIEAVLLAPAGKGAAQANPAPEYQILYADGLRTPWTAAGERCGSQGLGLAARTIRFRLTAETAPFFDCRYDLAFTDGSRRENLSSTEIVLAPPGAALAAIRLHITQRPVVPLIVLTDIDTSLPPPWADASVTGDPRLRLQLLSPAFSAALPTIRNGALIPAESWAAMNVSFRRSTFPGRTVTLREVEDATIVAPGLVFDRDLNYVPVADDRPAEAVIAEARATLDKGRSDEGLRRDGISLFCRTLAPANYGHLLIEALSKAWLGQKALGERLSNIVLQNSPLVGLVRQAIADVGVGPVTVDLLGDQPLRCSRLFLIDGLTEHGVYQSPLCLQPLRQLAAPIVAVPAQKLFISRSGARRALLNQPAVEAALHAQGFAIIDPGQMTLADQIALFKGAELVVGPLGAALTNIAFCQPGTRVVALSASSFPDTFFWFIAQHAGLHYEEIRGQDAGQGPVASAPWDAGFTVTEDDIAYLAAL